MAAVKRSKAPLAKGGSKKQKVVKEPVEEPDVEESASVVSEEEIESEAGVSSSVEDDSSDEVEGDLFQNDDKSRTLDSIIKKVFEVGTQQALHEAFNYVAECWLSNGGLTTGTEEGPEARVLAFAGLRALLDISSGKDKQIAQLKKKDKKLNEKELTAKLIRILVKAVAKKCKGPRLHWHIHKECAFLAFFTLIRDLGLAVRKLMVLHSKPRPRKKKDLSRHLSTLVELEGSIYNWQFLIQCQIFLNVFAQCTAIVTKKGDNAILDNRKDDYEEVLFLGFPLYSTMMACLKFKWGKLGYLAFHCQLIRRLVELQISTKSYVPVGLPLVQLIDRMCKVAKDSSTQVTSTTEKDKGVAFTHIR